MPSPQHNIDNFFVELDFLLEFFLSDEPLSKEEKEKIVASMRASKEELLKAISVTQKNSFGKGS